MGSCGGRRPTPPRQPVIKTGNKARSEHLQRGNTLERSREWNKRNHQNQVPSCLPARASRRRPDLGRAAALVTVVLWLRTRGFSPASEEAFGRALQFCVAGVWDNTRLILQPRLIYRGTQDGLKTLARSVGPINYTCWRVANKRNCRIYRVPFTAGVWKEGSSPRSEFCSVNSKSK